MNLLYKKCEECGTNINKLQTFSRSQAPAWECI